MTRKVAIVGKAPTARLAPFSDLGWEIWGLAWVTYPRETMTFDPHTPGFGYQRENLARADAKHLPVIGHMSAPYALRQPFPFDEALALADGYLESSIAYMLAYAILLEVPVIGLWGVHMEALSEYAYQRPNLEYLIGLARGKGLTVSVCPGAPLLVSCWEAGRYGVSDRRRFFPY